MTANAEAQRRYREKNLVMLREKNRVNMAARRADPEQRSKLVASQRRTYYRVKYGMEFIDIEQLWLEQDCKCALCSKQAPAPHHAVGKASARLCVDHCHYTATVRGLLCYDCNTSLGKLGDTPDALRRVLEYIGG